MKHLVLASSCMLSAPLLGQSYLETAQRMFDNAELASLQDFKSSQVWEGRCVNARNPNEFFNAPTQGIARLAFDVSGDSISGIKKRFEVFVAPNSYGGKGPLNSFRRTISQNPSLFEKAYENQEWRSTIQWTGLASSNNSLFYLLRRAKDVGGDTLVVKMSCGDSDGCQFFSSVEPKYESYRQYGEAWGYCYFNAKVYDELLGDPNVPPPPPPPGSDPEIPPPPPFTFSAS